MPRHFGRYPVLKRAPLLLAEGVISNSFFFTYFLELTSKAKNRHNHTKEQL